MTNIPNIITTYTHYESVCVCGGGGGGSGVLGTVLASEPSLYMFKFSNRLIITLVSLHCSMTG